MSWSYERYIKQLRPTGTWEARAVITESDSGEERSVFQFYDTEPDETMVESEVEKTITELNGDLLS